jgi:hypothetical protein
MTLEEKIVARLRNWGRKVCQDMRQSIIDDLGNDQETALNFDVEPSFSAGVATIKIVASDDYWAFIEFGVKGTGNNLAPGQRQKAPNSPFSYKGKYINTKAVGLKWQGSRGIQPKKVLAEIQAKKKPKYSRLTSQGKRLSKPKKELSTEGASKTLSIIFAGSIAKQGLEPHPFINKVLNEDRLAILTGSLSELMGAEITASLSFDPKFKELDKIKIEL